MECSVRRCGNAREIMEQQLAYFDRSPHIADGHKTGVSLHRHTLHSKENARPLGKHLQASGIVNTFLRTAHLRYGTDAIEKDLARVWWTPPLTPGQALDVESRQIEDRLGLAPIVSITDHDSIQAPMQLQLLKPDGRVPVSVEWTVPYRDTYFHVGIHNLPLRTAAASMADMARFTAQPDVRILPELLRAFYAEPGCLIILHHPYWDQPRNGADLHDAHLERFMDEFRNWIHALEINGMRDWRENQRTIALSKHHGIPLMSGGDRHGREPNAVLNLTRETTFAVFADEVRAGVSRVVLMPQYRKPLALRIIENFADIVSEAPGHGLGWRIWTDRVVCPCNDGGVRSRRELCGAKPPFSLRFFTAASHMLSHPFIKPALEWAMPQTKELG